MKFWIKLQHWFYRKLIDYKTKKIIEFNKEREKYLKTNNMKLWMWIARDADETLCLYTTKPWKRVATDYHNNDFDCDDEFMTIDNRLFPEVTFENSPQQVELKLVDKV